MLTFLTVVSAVIVLMASGTPAGARVLPLDANPRAPMFDAWTRTAVPFSQSSWHMRGDAAADNPSQSNFRWTLAHLTARYTLSQLDAGASEASIDNQVYGSTVSCSFTKDGDGWLVAAPSVIADPHSIAVTVATRSWSVLFDHSASKIRSSETPLWTWIGAPSNSIAEQSALHVQTLNGNLFVHLSDAAHLLPILSFALEIENPNSDPYLSWLLFSWLFLALPFHFGLRSVRGR